MVIIGGGLAGLTAAIHLSHHGLQVCLFEKEGYPHHKVCGEYLSKEILPYLQSLDISLSDLKPVEIDRLIYSTSKGKPVTASLGMGGIGISRFALDHFLYQKAMANGVKVFHETVSEVSFDQGKFKSSAGNQIHESDFIFGAFGKRSILDKKLKRNFIEKRSEWLAVKAHYAHDSYPSDTVSLHNFPGGYCGLSKTETGAINVCYLATFETFKKHRDPENFKKEVLCKNPFLNSFFGKATPLFEKNLSIAQVYFEKKTLIQDHVIMLGDAAGLIHPLCGNGMAMAIHSAKIASEAVLRFFESGKVLRQETEKEYIHNWKRNFKNRIRTGRVLQKILLNPSLEKFSQNTVSFFPAILPAIIKNTHGSPVL